MPRLLPLSTLLLLQLAGCAALDDVSLQELSPDEQSCVERGFRAGLEANKLCAAYAALDRQAGFDPRPASERMREQSDRRRSFAFFAEVRASSRATLHGWTIKEPATGAIAPLRKAIAEPALAVEAESSASRAMERPSGRSMGPR
jgi:hypothetical protein